MTTADTAKQVIQDNPGLAATFEQEGVEAQLVALVMAGIETSEDEARRAVRAFLLTPVHGACQRL